MHCSKFYVLGLRKVESICASTSVPDFYVSQGRAPFMRQAMSRSRDTCAEAQLMWKGYISVFGAILINLSTGSIYCYGNLIPYVVSYIRVYGNEHHLTYQTAILGSGIMFSTVGLGMIVSGFAGKRFGVRSVALGACFLSCLSVFATAQSVKVSFYLFLFTYCGLFGFLSGSSQTPPLVAGMKWFPQKRGLVSGLVQGSYSLSPLIFNLVQTAFINPGNKAPNQVVHVGPREEIYYTQDDILRRVPKCFLLLGGVFAILQLVGVAMLHEPPDIAEENEGLKLLPPQQTSSLEDSRPNREGGCDQSSVCMVPANFDSRWSGLSLTTAEVARHLYAWQSLSLYGSCILVGTLFTGIYKEFGQLFIADDMFLAAVGSVAAVANLMGHLVTGFVLDRMSIKVVMLVICGLMAALQFSVSIVSLGGRFLYLVWVCGIFGMLGGSFAILPVLVMRAYGESHFPSNYACYVFIGLSCTSILGSVVTTSLQNYLSWYTLFIFLGIIPALAMVFGTFMNLKNPNGHDV